MRVFVTGASGQLGQDVIAELKNCGVEAIGTDILPDSGVHQDNVNYLQLDITDSGAVSKAIEKAHPDAVIHCAAWTDVEAAENPDNRDKVFAINESGTRNIATACKNAGAKMLYVSTDYVFDGHGVKPWQPDHDYCAPLNVYGKSKLSGEIAVTSMLSEFFIVRTSWLFGHNGKNFIKTMINLGKEKEKVHVVNDQVGTPTYSFDLARLLVQMVKTEKYGYYHATNEGGFISWYEFCCEIYRQYGLFTQVVPVSTEAYGLLKAARPKNSRLATEKLATSGFFLLPSWKDAVSRYLKEDV